jgi:hypothetical protein
LPSGQVLVAGGLTNTAIRATAELFDSSLGYFVPPLISLIQARAQHTATALATGKVLLAGGMSWGGSVASTELYDPISKSFSAGNPMQHSRQQHTATLLRDGRVLVAGGLTCCQVPNPSPEFIANTAEIYDPATGRFTETGSMATGRGSHAAALLPDGRVLISGGDGNDSDPNPLGTEIYDPATGQFSRGGNLMAARDTHSAVTLADGRVLVIGGEVPPSLAGRVGIGVPSTEIFDPVTSRWSPGPALSPAFFAATVTMLSNGKVLVFGGEDHSGSPQSAAALFE